MNKYPMFRENPVIDFDVLLEAPCPIERQNLWAYPVLSWIFGEGMSCILVVAKWRDLMDLAFIMLFVGLVVLYVFIAIVRLKRKLVSMKFEEDEQRLPI